MVRNLSLPFFEFLLKCFFNLVSFDRNTLSQYFSQFSHILTNFRKNGVTFFNLSLLESSHTDLGDCSIQLNLHVYIFRWWNIFANLRAKVQKSCISVVTVKSMVINLKQNSFVSHLCVTIDFDDLNQLIDNFIAWLLIQINFSGFTFHLFQQWILLVVQMLKFDHWNSCTIEVILESVKKSYSIIA